MTRRLAVVFLAAAAVCALPSSAEARARCKVKGSETVKSNSLVRVYSRPDREGGTELRGCWRATGRKVLLAYEFDDEYVTSSSYRDLRLAGRFVAFVWEATDVSCKAACPPDYQASRSYVEVRDMRTRRERSASSAPAYGSLKLSSRGVAAWLDPADAGYELLVTDGVGAGRLVDAGAIDGVGLRGLRLGWKNGGVPRGVDLTPL
jgi:hypothetical protein